MVHGPATPWRVPTETLLGQSSVKTVGLWEEGPSSSSGSSGGDGGGTRGGQASQWATGQLSREARSPLDMLGRTVMSRKESLDNDKVSGPDLASSPSLSLGVPVNAPSRPSPLIFDSFRNSRASYGSADYTSSIYSTSGADDSWLFEGDHPERGLSLVDDPQTRGPPRSAPPLPRVDQIGGDELDDDGRMGQSQAGSPGGRGGLVVEEEEMAWDDSHHRSFTTSTRLSRFIDSTMSLPPGQASRDLSFDNTDGAAGRRTDGDDLFGYRDWQRSYDDFQELSDPGVGHQLQADPDELPQSHRLSVETIRLSKLSSFPLPAGLQRKLSHTGVKRAVSKASRRPVVRSFYGEAGDNWANVDEEADDPLEAPNPPFAQSSTSSTPSSPSSSVSSLPSSSSGGSSASGSPVLSSSGGGRPRALSNFSRPIRPSLGSTSSSPSTSASEWVDAGGHSATPSIVISQEPLRSSGITTSVASASQQDELTDPETPTRLAYADTIPFPHQPSPSNSLLRSANPSPGQIFAPSALTGTYPLPRLAAMSTPDQSSEVPQQRFATVSNVSATSLPSRRPPPPPVDRPAFAGPFSQPQSVLISKGRPTGAGHARDPSLGRNVTSPGPLGILTRPGFSPSLPSQLAIGKPADPWGSKSSDQAPALFAATSLYPSPQQPYPSRSHHSHQQRSLASPSPHSFVSTSTAPSNTLTVSAPSRSDLHAGATYSIYSLGDLASSPGATSLAFPNGGYTQVSVQPGSRTPSPLNTPDRIESPKPQRPVEDSYGPEQWLKLGIRYHSASETQDNLRTAATCFHRAATVDGGCPGGQLFFGLALRSGWGVTKDERAGFSWLKKACDEQIRGRSTSSQQGAADAEAISPEMVIAIYEVAQCFLQGIGIKKDAVSAVQYLGIAARLGDMDAQLQLAACYLHGVGLPKGKVDKKQAAAWYRSAIDQGASKKGLAWIYKSKYS